MSNKDKQRDSKGEGRRPEDCFTAMLAILADDEAPIGEKPSLWEIQAWHLGKLNSNRAAEVKTHVARDPECYQLWSDLMAEEDLEKSFLAHLFSAITSYIKTWFVTRPAWWVSGGAVTAMLGIFAFLYVPYMSQPWSPLEDPIVADVPYDWPWQGMGMRRGGELSYRQKIAFQTGLKKGMSITTEGKGKWADVIAKFPKSTIACESDANPVACEQQTKLLTDVGLYAGVMYLACLANEAGQASVFSDVFWKNQTDAWKTIGDALDENNLPDLAKLAHKLNLDNNRDSQCRVVRDLINIAY